jgi:hypothetical protein
VSVGLFPAVMALRFSSVRRGVVRVSRATNPGTRRRRARVGSRQNRSRSREQRNHRNQRQNPMTHPLHNNTALVAQPLPWHGHSWR